MFEISEKQNKKKIRRLVELSFSIKLLKHEQRKTNEIFICLKLMKYHFNNARLITATVLFDKFTGAAVVLPNYKLKGTCLMAKEVFLETNMRHKGI